MTSPAWTASSPARWDGFGYVVAAAGDVNGDGHADLAVGAPLAEPGDMGAAYVYLGSTAGFAAAPDWSVVGAQRDAWFGATVAPAGDVNGDGYDDLLIGAAQYDGGARDEGRVELYLGSSAGLAASPAWTVEWDQGDAYLHVVAGGGDVDGDGYDDVLLAAPYWDAGASDGGRVSLYRGGPAGPDTSPAWTLTSDTVAGHLGTSVAIAGDVDGDGRDDVLVGVSGAGGSWEGEARLYLGAEGGLAESPVWTVSGARASEYFGSTVAAAGDVNGDGYADIAVGTDDYTDTATDQGAVWVYLGGASGPSTTAHWSAVGSGTSAWLGRSVSALDYDDDGYDDLLVGSAGWSDGEEDEGVIQIWYGSSAGLDASVGWSDASNVAERMLGWSVAGVGDVNGDGADDLVASAMPTATGEVRLHLGTPTPELCDGIDNDGDGAIDADGLVTYYTPDGVPTDWSATLGAGSWGAPARVTLPGEGTLNVCRGEYIVNLVTSGGSLDIVGMGQPVVLSAGGVGRVLHVATETADMTVTGVALRDGAVTSGSGTGGCVRVSAGALTLVDSEVSGCVAERGGGVYLAGGSLTLTGSAIEGNEATDGAGLYLAGGAAWLTDSLVSHNVASGLGGGAYVADRGLVACAAEPDAAAGFLANQGGGVHLATARGRLRSVLCDWGTTADDDNDPVDVQVGAASYSEGDNAGFLCAAGACR